MSEDRKSEFNRYQECSINEAESRFISGTRLFSKKRKIWPGKKKPIEMKEIEDAQKAEDDAYLSLKKSKIKTTCVYCGKDYR